MVIDTSLLSMKENKLICGHFCRRLLHLCFTARYLLKNTYRLSSLKSVSLESYSVTRLYWSLEVRRSTSRTVAMYNNSLVQPKFHCADFATKSRTRTNHVVDFHDLCPRLCRELVADFVTDFVVNISTCRDSLCPRLS